MSKQYIELGRRLLAEGEMIHNERTGKGCLTLIDANLVYNVGAGEFPADTTRESNIEGAIAEIMGYIRGYDVASKFAALGTKTWNANASAEVWLNSPYRRIAYMHREPDEVKTDYPPEGYMGRPYGPQLRNWRIPSEFQGNGFNQVGSSVDQLRRVYEDLRAGKDNRAEILMMWNPGENHLGCLNPCLYGYQFSLVNGTLHLHATQRSCDVPLGLNYNMVQVYVFLAIMAKITGNKPGKCFHKLVNAHVYEDQLENFKEHMTREAVDGFPKLILPENLNTLEDVETWLQPSDFKVEDYHPQESIKYAFSV